MAKTINLDSRTTPDVCKELVNLEFNYGRDKNLRKYSHHMFVHQKREIEDRFSEWLHETNVNLLQEIEIFIKDCLSDSSFFEQLKSNFLNAANVILGMTAADYVPTIDSIEQHINVIQHDIRVLRIESGLSKRKDFEESLSQIKGQENVLVIIERTETIEIQILKSLVWSLSEMLQDPDTNRIVILFCMSHSNHTIKRILPLDMQDLMCNVETIVKNPCIVIKEISSRILLSADFSFNLSPQIIIAIIDDFLYNDPSVTNLRYLYQYSLFQHYMRNRHLAILLLPRNDMIKILKSEPSLISSIKNLKSISPIANSFNWKDPSDVACLCHDRIEDVRNYQQFVVGQMQYYLDMIRDETGVGFCELIDIYCDLVKYDDLGHSPQFVNAINNLQKYSTASISERLEESTRHKIKLPKLRGNLTDVYSIFIKFKKKLINNDNSRNVVIELIDTLLKHTQELKNPLNMPFSEVLFYSGSRSFEEGALPSDWAFTPEDFTDKSTPFGILYDLIQVGNEEISAVDLFNDFKCEFEELECRKLKDLRLSRSGVKLKIRPKRLRNTMAPVKINGDKNIVDEGLLKALFLDLLIDMENMGLLKSDKRMSAKGLIKVRHWFD